MNEHFAQNMTGKAVSFQVQPYSSGRGVTKAVTPRRVKHSKFCPTNGNTIVEYEVFDVDVEVAEGSEVRGLYCGVPVSPAESIAGTVVRLGGIKRCDLWRAVSDAQPIIIARCG